LRWKPSPSDGEFSRRESKAFRSSGLENGPILERERCRLLRLGFLFVPGLWRPGHSRTGRCLNRRSKKLQNRTFPKRRFALELMENQELLFGPRRNLWDDETS